MSSDGTEGWGEGLPREYVTGEALPDALAFTTTIGAEVRARVRDLDTLRTLVAEERPAIDAHPAAWCALELALLDLFGKRTGSSVEELVGSIVEVVIFLGGSARLKNKGVKVHTLVEFEGD